MLNSTIPRPDALLITMVYSLSVTDPRPVVLRQLSYDPLVAQLYRFLWHQPCTGEVQFELICFVLINEIGIEVARTITGCKAVETRKQETAIGRYTTEAFIRSVATITTGVAVTGR
ncbi:hypothetical protein MAR_011542 [Mya arenaria]|uniref:Uncharacterized protein n=1 Tax=Mya arenaria TaxID=6604 RepID=A0ABY7FY64_MYAAR|nr:hypothetical protein MAR_011542 [Mya arenaria]